MAVVRQSKNLTDEQGPGFLMVGTNKEHRVVVNLDKDRVGHIIFSPDEARKLAVILIEKAACAEGRYSNRRK